MSRLRPGIVSSIRVNPKDCMSVIDVMDKAGVNIQGMSFSGMVSLALSSLLENCRQQELIPTRDGFEFTEMVGPYLNQSHAKKVHVTNTIGSLGSRIQAPAIENPKMQIKELVSAKDPISAAEVREAGVRMTELLKKKDMAGEGTGVIWQQSDEEEFQRLYAIVYPEG
jgi:hypothetical protein